MSELGEFCGLSIHQSFCMPAKRWEAQQEAQALACKCDNLILASDCTASWAVGSPGSWRADVSVLAWGEHGAVWQGVFYREDGRIINVQK